MTPPTNERWTQEELDALKKQAKERAERFGWTTEPTTEELVERVRRRVALEHPLEWRVDAEAALATLSERLEAAERERDEALVSARQDARYYWLVSRNEWRERAKAAEAERDRLRDILKGFLHDAEQGDLPGKGLREMARAALADQEGEA